MVLEGLVDREIRDKVSILLAYQRDSPIHVRIICPLIRNVVLPDHKTISQKLRQLITNKSALVTLVVNPRWMKKTKEDRSFLQGLEDAGVKVHYKRDLHAKAVLLDSKHEYGLLVSTANLTTTGLDRGQEVGIYILNDHREVFEKLDRYITGLLKENKKHEKKT
jgi:phosphatidylserine/phosphatidylglycerophosphate/cardiolipin synthase-like enzyme